MKVQWYRYPETRPPKRGDYLVLFSDETDGKELSAEVATYCTRGETIGSLPSCINGTAEEKLADSIFHHPIIVEKEGFYTSDSEMERFWELKPLFWADLPEAPQGFTYEWTKEDDLIGNH